jgi:mycothiol system anti-sigma-R factor
MIDCRVALARLYEYLDSELAPEQVEAVKQHLEACRPCFQLFEFERLLAEYMRKAAAGPAAGEPLKARIAERLRELEHAQAGPDEELFPAPPDRFPDSDRMPGSPAAGRFAERRAEPLRRAGWSYLLVAAAVVLVALPFFRSNAPAPGETAELAALVTLHVKEQPQLESSDPDRLVQWVRGMEATNPMAREFKRAGCGLRGAAVDSIWTHLFAESGHVPVSVFVADRAKFVRPEGMTRMRYQGEEYYTAKSGDFALVMWECPARDVVCLAVAALPDNDLLQLAHAAELASQEPGSVPVP